MKVMTLEGLGLYTPPHSYTPTTVMPTPELARLRGLGSAVTPYSNGNVIGASLGLGIFALSVKHVPISFWLPGAVAALVGGWYIGGKLGA